MIPMVTKVRCPRCSGETELDFKDDVKQIFEMDGCTAYQVEYEVERSHCCPYCGARLESFGSFWEFPEDTVHMVSLRTLEQ